MIGTTALCVVAGRGQLDAGLAALSLSYALTVSHALNGVVRVTAEQQTNICAVHHISALSELPEEENNSSAANNKKSAQPKPAASSGGSGQARARRAVSSTSSTGFEDGTESSSALSPDANWPSSGQIIFQSVFVRFQHQQPPPQQHAAAAVVSGQITADSAGSGSAALSGGVAGSGSGGVAVTVAAAVSARRYALNGVSGSVRPRQRVGVVGRSGAGKHTLFSAILRLVEVHPPSLNPFWQSLEIEVIACAL